MAKEQVHEFYVGLQWGDEGKGKVGDEAADYALSLGNGRTIVVRFQGGSNAGHTVWEQTTEGLVKMVTHVSPSGLAAGADIGIGPAVAFNPVQFLEEIGQARELCEYDGRIMISERAGILFDYHKILDGYREGLRKNKIGTTGSGIGPFYEDNARRDTRITFDQYISPDFPDMLKKVFELKKDEFSPAGIGNELLEKLIAGHEPIRKELAQFSEALEYRLQEYLADGHIIIEGAQGTMLDRDMGTIPDVSSSGITAYNAFATLGLPRSRFRVYGIEKAYPTRVGSGPMPTLAEGSFRDYIDRNAGEFGATTGRRRRAGYPDWVLAAYSAMINDIDGIVLTRADVIQDQSIKVCTEYDYDGEQVAEVRRNLHEAKPVYDNQRYMWHFWDGPENLSEPDKVHQKLESLRQGYVDAGFQGLPKGMKEYIAAHDKYIGRPIVAVSIGPARRETVWKEGI